MTQVANVSSDLSRGVAQQETKVTVQPSDEWLTTLGQRLQKAENRGLYNMEANRQTYCSEQAFKAYWTSTEAYASYYDNVNPHLESYPLSGKASGADKKVTFASGTKADVRDAKGKQKVAFAYEEAGPSHSEGRSSSTVGWIFKKIFSFMPLVNF